MKPSNTKNNKSSGTGPYLLVFLFCAALIPALSLVQIPLAGTGDPARLRLVLLGGGLVKTLAALAGMGALFRGMVLLSRRTDLLKRMVRPLEEKKFRALAELPEADPRTGLSDLRDSLAALGGTLELLRSLVETCAAKKEEFRSGRIEEKAIVEHLSGVIEELERQCSGIEESAGQAGEALGGMENTLGALQDETGEQVRFMEQAAKDLEEAASAAGTAASGLEQGSGTAKALEEKIAEGEARVLEVNDAVKNISKDVDRIAEFAGLINRISEQTNLLSMNAAIESAHAGAAGAGFAVVADEIKKLAESTRENAGLIQEELAGITKKTGEALNAGERSSQSFSGISGELRQFTGGLKDIAEAAEKSRTLNGAVEGAVRERAESLRRMDRDGGDLADRCRHFARALERIRTLTDKTGTEAREIRSGIREILEKISVDHPDLSGGLAGFRELRSFFPEAFAGGEGRECSGGKVPSSGTGAGGGKGPEAASIRRMPRPRADEAGKSAAAGPAETAIPPGAPAEAEEAGLNGRGVAVKQAPRIIF
jgi:methyl-accepting chemotaxis protein